MKALVLAATLAIAPTLGSAFEIGFEWGGLKLCTSGNPNTVTNPKFTLKDVPAGTEYIRFRLVDRNVPSYNHGGGTVKWDGKSTVAPGMFKYKSPCPPGGRHTYEWTATALKSKTGGKLGEAKARRTYPE